MQKLLNLAVLSAALTGCASIDKHHPVPGWPALKVVEHHVAAEEVLERCQRFVRFSVPEGCTVFHFDRSEAHIYVRKDFPVAWVLQHERLHAAGYDHVGSTAMQRMLETWKASQLAYPSPPSVGFPEPIPVSAVDSSAKLPAL